MKHYNTIIGAILVFFAALSVVGTALYYLVGFGLVSMGVAILVAATVIYLVIARSTPEADDKAIQSGLLRSRSLPRTAMWGSLAMTSLIILSLDIIALAALVIYRTTDAIRSPWETVPPVYFVLFWTASLLLILLSRKSSWTLPLATLHTFTGWSVALLVYQVGFGFDPFIHQAAEKIIAADGVVRPLTPYYIGQYVIVVTLHRLTTIPLDLIDRWLLPVLASIAVPYLLHSWSSRREPALERGLTSATPTFSLAPLATLIPATTFIMTTPQGLGNLWLLLTAFTLAKKVPISNYQLPTIFALAALATHPIAGIPALALVTFQLVIPHLHLPPSFGRGKKLQLGFLPLAWQGGGLRWGISGLLFFFASLSLPAAFALQHFATIRPHLPPFNLTRLLPPIQNHYDWPLDFVYLVGKNFWIFIVGLAAIGFYTSWSSRRKPAPGSNADLRPLLHTFVPNLITSAALFVSYLITTTLLDFGGLIDYETTIFPRRLLEVATIVLLPLVAKGLETIFCHSEEHGDEESPWRSFTAFRMTSAILLASIMTASIYLTYPRVDKYDKSSGHSVSAAMVQAVHWIESDRAGRLAIILADQNAAAAQIHNYGFGPYYRDNYFYAHPSGGLDLYRYYLRIVDNREDPGLVAREAMAYADVSELYLVVPTYWKNARHAIAAARAQSAVSFGSADGSVFTFHFTR